MMQFLAEWAIRSSILIACGALLFAVLRVKDSSLRLAGWNAMLAGSLLIPLTMTFLPPVPIRIFHSQPPAQAHVLNSVTQRLSGLSIVLEETQRPIPREAPPLDWMTVVSFAYGLAAALMMLRLLTGFAVSLRLLRKTQPTTRPEFRESSCVNSPVTIGLIRPEIVLPLDWPQWEPAKLRAVLAHESAHIRRRDPLVQFVSAIHRAALWFSPFAWLLHSRIVAIAEEASDDVALTEVSEPAVYAELLLDFMRRPVLHSRPAGIPMARYGRPDRRIQRILNAKSFSRGLTRWSIVSLLVVATPLTYLAAASRPQKTEPQTIAQAAPPNASTTLPRIARPKFSVASIKPCDPDASRAGGRGKAGAYFRRNCVTVKTLIQDAYIRFADGNSGNPMLTPLTKIEGGPTWIDNDRYTVEAEPEESTTGAMMGGPMMQTLLEDRFQLRAHRETREGLIYELIVAKGGSKLLPAKQGPCLR
ncbi:MAG TPA: M56 family metallopeptidase, partial [Bryobacteraceae bacterium]